ncbi:MAG TPA: porin [Bryobacteraceae bacterium]|jgi:hypothetical protein|nr:porin [Bryobacteraceae bacterium]
MQRAKQQHTPYAHLQRRSSCELRALFFQGEYFWYNVDRGNLPGLSSVKFNGGYAQASWVLTGEVHSYNSAAAASNGIVPLNPFTLTGGGWGAWEIAARVSTIDLNDELATANGVARGTPDGIYGGLELVRQSECPVHVRLSATATSLGR